MRVLVLHQVWQWRAALLAEADEGVDRSGKGLRRFSIVWVRGPAAQKIVFFNASGDLVFSQLDEERRTAARRSSAQTSPSSPTACRECGRGASACGLRARISLRPAEKSQRRSAIFEDLHGSSTASVSSSILLKIELQRWGFSSAKSMTRSTTSRSSISSSVSISISDPILFRVSVLQMPVISRAVGNSGQQRAAAGAGAALRGGSGNSSAHAPRHGCSGGRAMGSHEPIARGTS